MKVVLFFDQEKSRTPGSARHVMFGKYGGGGFLFVHENCMEVFWTSQGGEYRRLIWKKQYKAMWDGSDTDFLVIGADEEEQHKLWSTCDVCVKAQKPFNLVDLLLIHIPFRDVEDRSVIDAPTLNNPQAIVLILRECLRMDNPLRNGIDGLNSRQVFLEDLFERVRPYCIPVLWGNLNNLVRWPADAVSDTSGVKGREH